MNRILLLAIVALALSVSGCRKESGDAPVARGAGLGRDWTAPNPQLYLRVSVQNSFTRDAVVALDGKGKHYELSVGPIRDAYLIVPAGEYDISAWSYGKSLGETKLRRSDEAGGATGVKGIYIQIRP